MNIKSINANGEVLQSIFFVGDVPDNIFKTLNRGILTVDGQCQWSDKKDIDILKNYYGSTWKTMFKTDVVIGGNSGKSKLNLDNDDNFDFNSLDIFEENGGKEGDEDYEEDVNGEIIPDKNKDDKSNEEEIPELKSKVAKFNIVDKSPLIFSRLTIRPEDTFANIKRKIQIVTGIDVFRQHLFYYNKNKPVTSYKLVCNETPIEVDWRSLKFTKSKNLMFDLALDSYMLDIKQCFVEALDEFMCTPEGIKEMYFMDILNVIPYNQDMIIDSLQLSIVYYGISLKFWPMMQQETLKVLYKHKILKNCYDEIAAKFPPLLENSDELLARFEFIDELLTIDRSKANIESIITKSTIQISPPNEHIFVNLRNVFDLIRTNSRVVAANLRLEKLSVKKRNHMSYSKHIRDIIDYFLDTPIKKNTILFVLCNQPINKLNILTDVFTLININSSGKYHIITSWSLSDNINIKNIGKSVKDRTECLISEINKLRIAAFPLSGSLADSSTAITTGNLGSISASILWKNSISAAGFKLFKNKMRIFEKHRIIVAKLLPNVNSYLLKFTYNITKYPNRNMFTQINAENTYEYRLNSTSNHNWYSYFSGREVKIFHRATDIKIDINDANNFNELEYIKSFLVAFLEYNKKEMLSAKDTEEQTNQLKKLHEQDPDLYDLKKYDKNIPVYARICQTIRQPNIIVPGEKIPANAVKYWNFTRNEPAYYTCENKKYQYLSFQQGVHPRGYCLPCCKKNLSLPGTKSDKVNKSCIDSNGCADEFEDTSTHILAYGKQLGVDRVSSVPQELIDGIFLNIIPSKENYKMHMIGVKQSNGFIEKAGFFYSILYTMMPSYDDPNEIIKEITDYIRSLTESYISLGNGIGKNFKSSDELADTFFESFSSEEKSGINKFSTGNIAENWESILADVFYDLYDFSIAVFNYIDGILTLEVKVISSHLVCLLNNEHGTYPIIIIDPVEYSKAMPEDHPFMTRNWYTNNTIDYDNGYIEEQDNVCNIISKIIEDRGVSTKINIFSLLSSKQFISKYNIETALLNAKNKCYGCLLTLKNGNSSIKLYCPLNKSIYPSMNISYELRPASQPYKEILELVNDFCKIFHIDERIYITNKDKKQIGISCNNLMFYHDEIDADHENDSTINMPYNPNYIDQLIIKKLQHSEIPERLEIDFSYKLYGLFLLEFASIVNASKNYEIRKKIFSTAKIESLKLSESDLKLVRQIIEEPNAEEILKNTILEADNSILSQLTTVEDVKKVMASKINIVPGPIKIDKINNIFTACENKDAIEQSHCGTDGKLKLTKESFDSFCELLCSDIKNDNKRYTILNNIGIIDINEFIQYDGENLIY